MTGSQRPILLLSHGQSTTPCAEKSLIPHQHVHVQQRYEPQLTLRHCNTATRYIRVLQQCSTGHDDPATPKYIYEKEKVKEKNGLVSP